MKKRPFIFALLLLISALSFFGIAHTAYAGDPVPDTSFPRPDFSTYSHPLTPDQSGVSGVPADWSCGSNGGSTMCQSPDRQHWLVNEACSPVPGNAMSDTVVYDCNMYAGTGNHSDTKTNYFQTQGVTYSISGTPTVDQNGASVGATQEGHSSVDSDIIGKVTLGVIAWILNLILEVIATFLTGILAVISTVFDWVSTEFVIQMGKYITSQDSAAIRTAWTLIRDLANIGIIGGLVATAIGTILGNDKYNVNKTLARLILAALLINFSYFFAGALIDASNFVANQAYKTIYSQDCTVQNQCGPASRFLRATSLDAWLDNLTHGGDNVTFNGISLNGQRTNTADIAQSGSQGNGNAFSSTQALVYNLMRIIFILITGFIFLSAIALLVARFVSLIFLLITSPIGIAGTAVPILQSYSSEWWKALRSQALFAPIYFLLVGLSLNILDAIHGSVLLRGTSQVDLIGIVAMFTIAIGFMWAALSIAKSMSAEAKWFSDIYKQAGNAFGWLPNAYTSGLRFAGGFALRETLGRGADAARQRLPGFSTRVQDWAKESRLGRALTAIPGVKMAASALDRAAQKQLDKTADQKFFAGKDGKGGAAGYKTVYDEREKRGRDLKAKKEALENEDKYDGTEAKKNLNKKERELKDKVKEDEKEIADLEKVQNRTKQQQEKLDAARNRLNNNKKELAGIAEFKANLKAHPNAGVTKKDPNNPNSEEIESAALNQLHADKQELAAKGGMPDAAKRAELEQAEKDGTISPQDKQLLALARKYAGGMDEIDAKIREEEHFEKQKDEHEWGGVMGRQRRGKAKKERAVAAGQQSEDFNEKASAKNLEEKERSYLENNLTDEQKQQLRVLEREKARNPAAFSETDPGKKGALQVRLEKLQAEANMTKEEDAAFREARDNGTYQEALKTPEADRTPGQKNLIKTAQKLTRFQQAERDLYREQSRPLTQTENSKLDADIKRRDAGEITDPKKLAEIDALEKRKKVGGILAADGVTVLRDKDNKIGLGLNEHARENLYAFRNRQEERDANIRRGVTEFKNEKTGLQDFELEDDYGYEYRLETGEQTGRLRDAIAEGKTIAGTLGPDYLKAEYRKNPRSILKYALTLSDEDTAKILTDHDINEEIRNEISLRRMRRFTDPFIELQQDLIDGKVQWGSEEYKRRSNNLFNQQTKYLPGKEVLAALKANAVIGELHPKDGGEPMHVRFKDLNSDMGDPEKGGYGNLRRLFWHSTSSTMFADAKDGNIFGREMTAEMGRDKRGGSNGTDRQRDIDHAMYEAIGLGEDKDFLQSTAGKVQMYAAKRADRAMRDLAKESKTGLERYGTEGDTQTLNDSIAARENLRLATIYQNSKQNKGPFNAQINNRLKSVDRNALRASLVTELNRNRAPEDPPITDRDIADDKLDSYIKLNTVHQINADEKSQSDDQKFFFYMRDKNKAAARSRAENWTETEAAAAWNERSLHSPIIAETITESQIPFVLKGKDPVDAARFWESYLMLRNSKEIKQALRSEAIKPVYQKPSKQKLININLMRLANGQDILDIPTSD